MSLNISKDENKVPNLWNRFIKNRDFDALINSFNTKNEPVEVVARNFFKELSQQDSSKWVQILQTHNIQKTDLDQDFENICTTICQSVLNQSKISKEIILKKELNDWAETQRKENQENIKRAKQRILRCYKSKGDFLDLSSLDLTSVPISVLEKLDDLTCLHLQGNHLTSFDEIDLPNLEELYLEHNHITSFVGKKLKELRILNLCNNYLKLFDGTGLRKLQSLDLDNNHLTSFYKTELPNLQDLSLSNNHLTSLDVKGFINLRWLDGCYNYLTSLKGTGLINLEHLHLSNNRFSSFDVTGFPKLRVLFLERNQLASLYGIGLTNLNSLYLNHNLNLSEISIALGQCPNLITVDILNTSIRSQLINTLLASCKALRDNSSSIDLPIKLNLWKEFAEINTDFDFISVFSKEEQATLNEWLNRLTLSKDFKTDQKNLAKVVCNILKDLQDKKFKEVALNQMSVNNKAQKSPLSGFSVSTRIFFLKLFPQFLD